MKHWWIVLLTGLGMLLGCTMHASAAEVRIYDEGSRLSSSDYRECEQRLQEVSDYTGMNIGVVLGTQSRTDLTIESVAKNSYTEFFGARTDGVMYYMDLKGYQAYDYIATSGMGQFYYTDAPANNRIDMIFSTLDDYLLPAGSENVPGALMAFADELEKYYDEGVPNRYYVYDDEDQKFYYLKNGEITSSLTKPYISWFPIFLGFLGGGFAGVIAALIMFLVVKMRYRFKYALSPTTYVNRKDIRYNHQYDHFVRTYTTKTRIESSSGGGGGGGGGGGHSSGGFGGGGHHR